jgi:hypothetical protein
VSEQLYTVIENTPGYLPEDDQPFVGSWDECCEVMDENLVRMLDEGWTITHNDGVGFRTPGGVRRTYLLPADSGEHALYRVVEVMPAD